MAVLLQAVPASSDVSILLVCLMGIGVVFVGLCGVILLVKLVSLLCSIGEKKQATEPVLPPLEEKTEITGELAAVIGCAIAEEIGCDAEAIRIVSIKKIG